MNLNYNDIRSDLLDVLIRNHNIGLAIEKIQYLVAPRNHDLTDTAAALVKLQVTYLPQLLTVPDVDHILTFQL